MTALGVTNAAAGSAHSPQTPAVSQTGFTLTGSSAAGAQLLSDTEGADGSATTSWALTSGDTLTVSGNANGTVSLDQRPTTTGQETDGELTLGLAPAQVDKSDPQAVLDAYQKADRSVVKDAVAVGVPSDEAATDYDQMMTADPYPGSTPLAVTPNNIIGSWCVSLSRPGGVAWAHSCMTRNLTQANGGNWYWADKLLASGNYPGPTYALDILRTYANYVESNGDDIIDWSPAGTRSVGSCKDQTTAITVLGVSYSQKTTVCPSRMDPYTVDGINHTFGAQWSGYDGKNYVESVSVFQPARGGVQLG
jgi:hypothetical protein